ncbi:MAG TPA: RHS repeat-associated core domain-containing protein [Polyangiaceae bacterium]|nr:RHS repeat-associated core domain-containing protein [Polyangiaceae bacterium]
MLGVLHVPVANGTACDDATVCNGHEICSAGICTAGTSIDTDDGIDCTDDLCNPMTGEVTHPLAPPGTECSPIDACHEEGTCDSQGQCLPGAAFAFDDGDPCTIETCDPVLGLTRRECSPIDQTVSTVVADANAWIYSGSDPLQTGVGPDTITRQRGALLTGHVASQTGLPLGGAVVTILNHPELGQTVSKATGEFTMVVNGGGRLTVQVTKPGFLDSDRSLEVPWAGSVRADEIRLLQADPQVTEVDLLDEDEPFHVVQGSVSEDDDGIRQGTLLLPSNTLATMHLEGSSEPINLMNIRITEFTVGPSGVQAMPAALPPTSHYTYAFEVNADEAVAAGARSIEFTVPLVYYVHNFLEFPSGTVVPVGSYSREKGVWIPEQNGLVIEVVSITGGLADVSIDADPQAETPAELAVIGIDDDERARLAELYFPGTSLWRVLIPHFTQPWDCNWGVSPPDDAVPPPPQPPQNDPLPDPTECSGSIIECENQVLRERLPIAGTPFSLNYSSFNVPGRTDAREVPLTITGPVPPASLQRVDVSVDVGNGTHAEYSFGPSPNQTFTYVWPAQDAFGRPSQGRQMASIEMHNVYTPVYQQTDAFGYSGNGVAITSNAARTELYLTSIIKRSVSSWEKRTSSSGLGGWSISVHHSYDALSQSIIRGDGRVQKATAIGRVAFTRPFGTFPTAEFIAAAPDGSVYTTNGDTVWRLQPDGVGTIVAGSASQRGFSGDNGPATAALLNRTGPRGGDLALGPDGSLYIADTGNFRVRRVSPTGIITTFAGNGQRWSVGDPVGDGELAVDVAFRFPHGLAVGSDGAVYIADHMMNRVRRVGMDGKISTVAGNGTGSQGNPPEDLTMARSAGDRLTPRAVAVLPDGTLLVADLFGWIRRYETNGRVTRAAGLFVGGTVIEGVDPAASYAGSVQSIAVAPDGTWYFSNSSLTLVHHVAEGIGTVVAGGGNIINTQPTGAPARSISLGTLAGVSDGPNGLYIRHNAGVTVLGPATPGIGQSDVLLASPDGDELYVFDKTGRHLKTRDAITGADKYTFVYTSGLLTRIDDAYGNATTITRDSAGTPLAITSPDGQSTHLTLDSSGYLHTVTDPLNHTATLTHSSSGLLTAYENPRGNSATFEYDAKGRLLRDQDAAGGAKELTRTALADGFAATYSTIGAGTRATDVHFLADGTQRRNITLPDGAIRIEDRRKDGSLVIQHPDGTKVTETQTGDPRYGVVAPVISTTTELPPIPPATQGLVRTENRSVSVTLSNPNDPLSVSTLTRQRTINGRIWSESYNQSTKTWTVSSPVGRRSFRILNTKGDLLRETTGESTNALLAQLLAYDARGRLSTVTQGSRQSLFSYFASGASAGYLETATNPLVQTTTFTRDALGRTLSELDPAGNLTQFGWDPLGNLASVTPPGQPQHDMSYTPVNLMSEYSPPVLASIPDGRTVYEYTIARQLERATRPDGLVTEYDYDDAGRLTGITTPNGIYHRDYYGLIPCAGCAAGYVSRITSPDAINLDFQYNGQLLTQSTWSGAVSGAVAFTYNNDFRVKTETVTSASGSAAYQFGFDNDQLLTCASPTQCTSPGSDALRLTYNSSNGLPGVSTLGTITETPTYNTIGELATQVGKVGTTTVFSEDYNPTAMPRDALGRIRRKIETVNGTTNTWDYSYDLAGRLETVLLNGSSYESYTYDGNGNRLTVVRPSGTTSATHDDQDRLLTSGPWTYTYTPNGELLSKSNSSTGENWGFEWDVFGNLKRVDLPNGDVIEYLVDGQNRRVGKKKNGALVKQWLYRGQLKPVAELDGAGNLVARFVWASRKNSPDLVITGGVTYRVFSDQLGSPRVLVNASTGAVAGVLRHDAWGSVLEDSVSALMPFGFAGGLYDAETGLLRFGARDYDPSVGRWVSKEPLRFAGGSNFYVYAFNDPVNWIDPNGLLPFWSEQVALEWIKHQLDRLTSYPDAVDAFSKNYGNMRDANTIGADKYFHCMANCEAAARGRADVAGVISDGREWVDENLKGDPANACAADQAANRHGRNSGADDEYQCRQACSGYRPSGLPAQY